MTQDEALEAFMDHCASHHTVGPLMGMILSKTNIAEQLMVAMCIIMMMDIHPDTAEEHKRLFDAVKDYTKQMIAYLINKADAMIKNGDPVPPLPSPAPEVPSNGGPPLAVLAILKALKAAGFDAKAVPIDLSGGSNKDEMTMPLGKRPKSSTIN